MAWEICPTKDLEEFVDAVGAIGHYFGMERDLERAERFSRNLPLERMHATFDGDRIVGGAGVFPFQLTIPGGPVACAGVTVVGVLPTHRRRGVLTAMMRAQLEDIRRSRRADRRALGLGGADLPALRLRPRLVLPARSTW